MTHQWIVKGDVDFNVDIEIDGVPINQRGYQVASSGADQALITPGAGNRLKIYRVTYTVSANVTGDVAIKIGATVLNRDQNPQMGGIYGFNIAPNFDLGVANEVLYINCPAGVTVDINVTSEEIT